MNVLLRVVSVFGWPYSCRPYDVDFDDNYWPKSCLGPAPSMCTSGILCDLHLEQHSVPELLTHSATLVCVELVSVSLYSIEHTVTLVCICDDHVDFLMLPSPCLAAETDDCLVDTQ